MMKSTLGWHRPLNRVSPARQEFWAKASRGERGGFSGEDDDGRNNGGQDGADSDTRRADYADGKRGTMARESARESAGERRALRQSSEQATCADYNSEKPLIPKYVIHITIYIKNNIEFVYKINYTFLNKRGKIWQG